ncbi:tripartite tricarboxylate transporter substrate binding protein [Acidovorax sp. D2M1]|uniref:Tripartite tricarboxylate transporter substrate binding protein n=1 Tax=Acidovorax benzenivorans TaxID=2987520 RepID=A0ABT5S005_9BURK|nr:tripartite tricarboxylate transporter substrate binding protein [Acidovorax benzenivorans]MDD2179274.1 tripartite tricarboxylate transporter substrate binding protein [Acidovorax benzenivorans]
MLNRFRAKLGFLLASFLLVPAQATEYPTKPVTVVVGYSAGGPLDSFMRALAPRLSEALKQPVVIDNRPGANESIAAQTVAKAPADGHTLLMSTESPLTQNQFLYKKLAYVAERDFAPITQLVHVPMALVVPASFPANTLPELLALARSRKSNPINYGSTGMGGVTHLPMAMFAKNNGLEYVHVPYKGASPLIPDLLSSNVDAAFLAVSAVAPYVIDRRLKALVVSAPARATALPQIPTFYELGIEDVQASFIMALSAPAGTSQLIIDKIAGLAQKIVADKEFRAKYMEPFAYVPVSSTPAEFSAYLAKDRRVQAERIRVSGASLD